MFNNKIKEFSKNCS